MTGVTLVCRSDATTCRTRRRTTRAAGRRDLSKSAKKVKSEAFLLAPASMAPLAAHVYAPRCALPLRTVAARKPAAAVHTTQVQAGAHAGSACVSARLARAPFARQQPQASEVGAARLHARVARLPRASVSRRTFSAVVNAVATPATTAGVTAGPLQWREVWWPVAFVQDLDASVPCPFTLLGEPIVLWREHGEWRAYADKCPHRLAPLTEGRINEDGRLECAYHGWAFAGPGGACESVPQDREGGTAKSSQRACVTSYPVAVKQGIVFVLPTPHAPDTVLPAVPIVPELDDPDFIVIDIARGACPALLHRRLLALRHASAFAAPRFTLRLCDAAGERAGCVPPSCMSAALRRLTRRYARRVARSFCAPPHGQQPRQCWAGGAGGWRGHRHRFRRPLG